MLNIKRILLVLFLLALGACTNKALEEKKDSDYNILLKNKKVSEYKKFNYWNFVKESSTVCYIYSFPISSSGKYLNRGIHYIIVNYIPKPKDDEYMYSIATVSGKELPVEEFTKVDIGNISYMFANNYSEAWAIEEQDFINNLIQSNENIKVFTKFIDNTIAVDTYAIAGFQEALLYLNSVC